MEKWLIDNLAQILLVIGAGTVALVKLHNFQESAVKEIKELSSDLKHHIISPTPHLGCPAHSNALSDIKESLKELRERLITIDDRVFELVATVKNGQKET